jgi:putative PIN family toxin of toxin-antitoxin system
VVLDTNVLVSALINSFGAPGRVLDLMLAGSIAPVYDDRILAEWREVLLREKLGFSPGDVEDLLGFIEREGAKVSAPVLAVELPDASDAPFLKVAAAAGATLITGNLKHYPPDARCEVDVVDARAFIDRWASAAR